jgi:AraC-like DNA-binding protein
MAVRSWACYTGGVPQPIAWYREYVPCEALRADVYALFTFVAGAMAAPPQRRLLREIPFYEATFCSPQFADGHVSLVYELGQTCDTDGRWQPDALALRGTLTGPMSGVGRTDGNDRPEMIGAYFRPARAARFLCVPVAALRDTAISIEDVWGSRAGRLSSELAAGDEASRLDRLEAVLLARRRAIRSAARAVDVSRLSALVMRRRGHLTVNGMARAAGVSRQYLTREFREEIGISPKLYSRLARFQSGLAYAGTGRVDWAVAAAHLGYADQSHMIAEFREFSALTPQALATGTWFHPFIERAKTST